MIKQIKYFQAVVRRQSFTKAVNDCFISQSAISQQLQALEKEWGVTLLLREVRKFFLIPAGDFFRKSLVMINDFDRLLRDTINIAISGATYLMIFRNTQQYIIFIDVLVCQASESLNT